MAPARRRYRSPRRKENALATRAAIVSAARRLFASRGYGRTSVADIARAARVSVQTIYDSVGSKAQLVLSLNDLIDEEGGVMELLPRRRGATDPREMIALHVKTACQVSERCGDLIRVILSAQADPVVAKVFVEGMRRHNFGGQMTAEALHGIGALRPGVDRRRAAIMLSLVTLPQALVETQARHGIGWDDLEAWITEALCRALLADAFRRP